ncbi:MAG: hypothetical protein V8R63_07190 [Thomasclavelia ramosa]
MADKAQAELKQDTDVLSGNIAIGCGEMRSAQEIAKLITIFKTYNLSYNLSYIAETTKILRNVWNKVL